MPANPLKNDFDYAVKNAGSGAQIALVHTRSIGKAPIPVEHKRLLGRVIKALEEAQDGLLVLANLPWPDEAPPGFLVPARRAETQMCLEGMIR